MSLQQLLQMESSNMDVNFKIKTAASVDWPRILI